VTTLASKPIKMVVATSTPGVFTTTANGSGVWSISGISGLEGGVRLAVWINDDAAKAFTLTKASTTIGISNVNLYQNYVILKHEGFTATSTPTLTLSWCDKDSGCGNSGDTDIPFTANSNAISVEAGRMLYVAPGSHFNPEAVTVTTHGNASTAGIDGDFKLATGLRQDGTASTSIFTLGGAMSVGGSWYASSTSVFTPVPRPLPLPLPPQATVSTQPLRLLRRRL